MPALCIPRRKSILIETIHHSQEPMSFFFFGAVAKSSPVLRSGTRASKSSAPARPPRRPFVDPTSPGIQFYRLSRNFGSERSVLVYLPCPPAVFASFFRRPVELCAAGFASFRGILPTRRSAGRYLDLGDITFR